MMLAQPPAPPTRATNRRCWLCGTTEGRMRADVHCSGLPLCSRCWTASPRGYNEWVRASSALAVRLGLPRVWQDSGFRMAWLEEVATRYRIRAWCDVDTRTTPAPEVEFGWFDPTDTEAAAVELTAREDAFTASRIGATGANRP